MAVYVTQSTDTIDSICFAFYGSSRGFTEVVLDANPDLALQPEILPPGLRILLPELPSIETQRQHPAVHLWQ